MKAVLFSSYFPCNRYISTFLIHENIVIDIYENYIKQTYRNRCNIMAANGISSLIVPVKKNNNCNIREIEIDYSEKWQKNHYRTIMSAYKNSAFYEFYFPEILPIFSNNYKFLIDLNAKILETIFKIINFSPIFTYSNNYIENVEIIDYRNSIHPKNHINLNDNNFTQEEYLQVFSDRHGFVENLSILDLIFNMGPLSLSILKKSITEPKF